MNNGLVSLYSEIYNSEWGNHPNFLYINYSQHAMGPYSLQYGKIITFGNYNLEMLMENFVTVQLCQNKDLIEQNLCISEAFNQLRSMIESLAIQRKNLKTRIS